MKRLLVLLTLVALTLSLTACGGTSGTTSGNASKETVQSSTTPAGSENTTPESDPSPESSKQPVADDPAPTSDELPSGYINYAEDASYSIYGQLGDPGDTITTTESDCFIYTIFIPELDIELVTAIDEKNGDYFCLYEYSKLYGSSSCSLIIYFEPVTLTYLSSADGKINMLYPEGMLVISKDNQNGNEPVTSIFAISRPNNNDVILVDNTLVEFSDSTFVLSQEKVDILVDTINLNF